jgi:Na+/melibiose symporter-like transporter
MIWPVWLFLIMACSSTGITLTPAVASLLLYITCVIYLAVALFSFRIKADHLVNHTADNSFANVKKGFAFIQKNKTFRYLTLISFFWRLFLGMQLSLFIFYVQSYLHCTSEQYGLFMTVIGLGSIAGSMLGPRMEKMGKPIRMITAGLGLHYVSCAFLGLCGNFYLSLFIVFVGYAALYVTLVRLHSLRDRITPFEFRSSAYGTVTAVLTPAGILSMLAGSYFAQRFSVAAVLLFSGTTALLSLFIINVANRRKDVVMQAE